MNTYLCKRVCRGAIAHAVAAWLLLAPDSRAQEPASSNPDVQKLLERLEKLEQRNEELEKTVRELKAAGSPVSQEKQGTVPDKPGGADADADKPGMDLPLDENAVRKIVSEFLEQSAPPPRAAAAAEDKAACRPDGTPSTGNIQEDLGILSRGVYETAIIGRILGPGRTAGFDDGFFLRTPDASNYLRIGSDLETDIRGFPDQNDGKDVDSFLVRRARINLDGMLEKYYDFRLMMDFSQKQSPTNTQAIEIIQDAYLNVHYWDAFQFEAGKYKQPIGYEQLIQDRYTPFIERSMFDQLLPGRDVGVMAHGEFLFSNRLDWAVSVANGEFQNLDFDTNDSKDFTYRLEVRPFNGSWFIYGLNRLQFSAEGTIGIQHENLSKTAANATNTGGFVLSTPGTIPWLTFNNNSTLGTVPPTGDPIANGLRTRFAPSVSYLYGSLGLVAQGYFQQQPFRVTAVAPASNIVINIPTTGFDIFGTYILTGEPKIAYSQAINPFHPVDPYNFFRGGWGAWEIGARVSRLEYGDQIFETFNAGSARRPVLVQMASPFGNSDGATEMTLGINWYWNRFFKIQFNWEHDWFDQPVQLGPAKSNLIKFDDALLTRFALVF
jgi:phosphate-selective porin OprO/OprP